jgi:hypothetical protein
MPGASVVIEVRPTDRPCSVVVSHEEGSVASSLDPPDYG